MSAVLPRHPKIRKLRDEPMTANAQSNRKTKDGF